MKRVVAALASLLALSPLSSWADASQEARLRARLAPEVAAAVIEIVRSAAAQGLPTAPLVARAMEGASRHASGDAIVRTIRRNALGLAAARAALGPEAKPAELEAGAGALLAGVPEDSLAGLRRARPQGSLVVPLVVLSDFVARGIPVETASSTVIAAARSGAADPALLRMRERIDQRILRGETPIGASREGLRELLARTGPKNTPQTAGEDARDKRRRRP